jgi:hypothetical protein
MSDELVKNLRSTYHATTPRKINTISSGQTVVHTAARTVVYRNPDGPAAADEIERLTAQLAEAQQTERAAVVAWLEDNTTLARFHWASPLIAAIEAGEHLTRADPVRAPDYRNLNILRDKLRDYAPMADSDGDDGA